MKDEVKRKRLEKLSNAAREIMGTLGETTLGERLNLIARHATEILEAEVCGVHIVKREGFLTLEASCGHVEGGFERGRKFEICSGPGSGLTGHIAFQGKLFNSHGDQLVNHFAVRGEKPTHLPSGTCYSLLAIPLMKKVGNETKLVGLLRAENKKGPDGVALKTLKFTKADEFILRIFAEAVVLALESAELVEQMRTQKEQMERLVTLSPYGTMAVDRQGHITIFNERAEEILGYTADEVLQQHLSIFYDDLHEPHRVGELLNSAAADGKLVQYESTVKSKSGEAIPLRHFATWLRSPEGECIGSVGYFEDLRFLKAAERREHRFELLLKASTIVAQASDLNDGMQSLAQMMVSLLPHTFCRILLLDESKTRLLVKAACFSNSTQGVRDEMKQDIAVSDFPGMLKQLEATSSRLLRSSSKTDYLILNKLTEILGLEKEIQSLLMVPLQLDTTLKAEEMVVGMLEFGELQSEEVRPFSQEEIDFATAIADKMSILIDRMRLHDQTKQSEQLLKSTFSKLTTLFKISEYIQAEQDLDKILHVVLTAVTANYGLKLNRAALFFLDDQGKNFVGGMGVGNLDEHAAHEDWKCDEQLGLNDLASYLELLADLPADKPLPKLTPIDKRIYELKLPVNANSPDVFSRVLQERRPIHLQPDELADLPSDFVTAFEPALPLVVIPLEARAQVIGLLVADNKFTRAAISDEDFNLLLTFANTAAIAIDNSRLLKQTQAGLEKLRALYEAAIALTSGQNPRKVLQDIVKQPPVAAEAAWVRVILINELEQPWDQIVGGTSIHLDLMDAIRPNGISMQVMRTRRVEKIEDTYEERDRLNPLLLEYGVAAALCFPFCLHGKPIGVVWINYDKPRRFQEFEIEALQLFVNQAAIAYDSARRMEDLVRLHSAAQAIAGAFYGVPEDETIVSRVNQTIVQKVTEIFNTKSATIWPYVNNHFLPKELVTTDVSEEDPQLIKDLELFRDLEPRPEGTAFTVLKTGWIGVTDPSDPKHTFLRDFTREYLQRFGIKSFQGVALKVGDEPVGVLFVGYTQHRRDFGEEDQYLLKNFATYAALALKNARLLDRVRRAKRAAEVVAKVTTLERGDATLFSVAEGTQKALDCDAVVLYAYDQHRNKWAYPPMSPGVWYTKEAWPNDKVPPTSVVYKIIAREEPYIAENVSADSLLQGRFAREEKIESCVALPLRVAEDSEEKQNVGVMFVNYRSRTRITPEELSDIKLFANQAAVAIRNIQLIEGLRKKLSEQKTLVDLSEALLGTVSLQETLNCAVVVAAKVLEVDFCNIVLPDDQGNLIFAAAIGWKPEMVETVRLKRHAGSQTGYTIEQEKPVIVEDYTKETRFEVPNVVHEHRLKSGMSVPMFRSGKIVGAMLVHTQELHRFTEAEVSLLHIVANQTAIAIQSAQQFEAIRRQSAHLSALLEASKVITASFGLGKKQVLDHIVNQAAKCIIGRNGPKAAFGTVQLYDEETNELVFESAYPSEALFHLRDRLGERRSLDISQAPDSRIGITGRVVLDKMPYLVQNVSGDPNFLNFNPDTRAELAVPLIDENNVLGVISLESNHVGAFDEDDKNTLLALAKLAAIAIVKARQYEDLKKTKGLVGARTALAWMGMTSSTWWHGVRGDTNSILNTIKLLREDLNGRGEDVEKNLQRIEKLALKIRERNITPPLSSEEGVESIFIEDLISERLEQLWKSEPYCFVERKLHLSPEDKGTVRASPAWLRRALDVIVDNAIEAMLSPESVPDPLLTVSTTHLNGWVEVAISDKGRGVPEDVRPKLFNDVVPSGKGLGMGLLLAQAIIQTYGGEIGIRESTLRGSTLVLRLPLEA